MCLHCSVKAMAKAVEALSCRTSRSRRERVISVHLHYIYTTLLKPFTVVAPSALNKHFNLNLKHDRDLYFEAIQFHPYRSDTIIRSGEAVRAVRKASHTWGEYELLGNNPRRALSLVGKEVVRLWNFQRGIVRRTKHIWQHNAATAKLNKAKTLKRRKCVFKKARIKNTGTLTGMLQHTFLSTCIFVLH